MCRFLKILQRLARWECLSQLLDEMIISWKTAAVLNVNNKMHSRPYVIYLKYRKKTMLEDERVFEIGPVKE